MPYQNSTGTTPVQSQYYNWQYFNHGMAKLQGVKPSGTNISYKAPEGVNYFDNWMGDVTNWLANGAELYSEWRMNESKKDAAKYLETHSLDEYKEDIQKNSVPFQYDVIAMSELKRGYGEITFNLAKQEWLDKVKSGEFAKKNLSDSAMDAEYFKFVREKQAEVCQTLGFREDDEDFVAGYYKNSPAARIEVGTTNRAVTDDWHIQQEKIQFNAKLQALASDSRVTPKQLGRQVVSLINGAGTRHMNPADVAKSLAEMMETLVASGNYDLESMRVLGDTIIDPKSKKTVRDYFGDGQWNLYATKAQNARTVADAESLYTLTTYIDNNVNEGNVEELEQQLQTYFSGAGGKVSGNDLRYKLLQAGIEKAKKQRELLLKAEQVKSDKDRAEQVKLITAKGYVETLATDARDQFEPKQFGVTQEDVQQAFNAILQDAALQDDSNIPDILMKYGFKTNVWFNPAREYIKNTWSKELGSFKSELIEYKRATAGGKTNAKLPDEPQCVKYTKQMLQKDSSRAWSILHGCGIDSSTLGMISALATSEQYGISWEEAVKGQANLQTFFDKELHPDGHQELAAINRTIVAQTDTFLRGLSVDGNIRDIIYNKALALYATNNDVGLSVKTAIGEVKRNTTAIGDTLVPTAFFQSNNLDGSVGKKYTEEFLKHEYPTDKYTYIFNYANNALVICYTTGPYAGTVKDVIRYSDNLSRNIKLFEQHSKEHAEELVEKKKRDKLIFENFGYPDMGDQ